VTTLFLFYIFDAIHLIDFRHYYSHPYLQPLVHRTTLNLYCFYEQFYVLPKLLINFQFILFSLLFFLSFYSV
jgi:hypothetical protein